MTQSFPLGRHKAVGVRITDRSGRVRDEDRQPLTGPGVSIIGIGVR